LLYPHKKENDAKWKRFRANLGWKSVSCLERKFKPKTKKLFLFWRNSAILAATPYIVAAAAARKS